MTKQEKYEKKMAKYQANRVRKAQLEKIKQEKEQLSKGNNSYRYLCPTLLEGDTEAKITKIANDFFEKRMSLVSVPVEYNGEMVLLVCANYGTNTVNVGFECFCFGLDFYNEIAQLWNKCFQKANKEYMTKLVNGAKNGVAHLHHNYIPATEDKIEDYIRKIYLNEEYEDILYMPEPEDYLVEIDGEVENGVLHTNGKVESNTLIIE